jgi:enamine deaminase RidA (YjgF/YER057c/UK114 family)
MTTTDITRFDQNQRRSRAIVHNGIVYLSGHVPDDMNADIGAQTAQVLAKIDALLQEVGSSRERLLTAQIWLKTMDDFKAMNAVWDAWVVPGKTPTRCCGKVEMNNPACRIEITMSAAL